MANVLVGLIVVQTYKSVLKKKILLELLEESIGLCDPVGSFQHRMFYDCTIQRGDVEF